MAGPDLFQPHDGASCDGNHREIHVENVALLLFIPFVDFVKEKDLLAIRGEPGSTREAALARPMATSWAAFPAVIATFNQYPQLAAVGPHAVDGSGEMPRHTTAGKNDTRFVSGDLYIVDTFTDGHSKGWL